LNSGTKYETLNHSTHAAIESGLSFSFGDGENDGKYYSTGSAIRVYGGGHMTVEHSSKTFSSISLSFGSGEGSNTITTNVGSYSSNTWTGSSSSVTFNIGGTSGHRRISSVAITYEATGNPTITVNSTFEVYKDIAKAFTITYSNLTDNISVTQSGTGSVSMSTTEGGTHTASLTLSKNTASPQTFYVKGTAVGELTLTFSSTGVSPSPTCAVTVKNGPAYSTGFESSDGFSATTTYNTTKDDGPTGKKWHIVYGSASTTGAISGTASLLLRYYNNGPTPEASMSFDVASGHSISFKAKSTTNSTLTIFYSTNSGSSWTSLTTKNVTSTTDTFSAEIATYVDNARFKIAWNGTTNKKDLIIDDVEVYTMDKPTEPVITITSKDGSGEITGVLGDEHTVTYKTENDTGLTVNWVYIDTDSIATFNSSTLKINFNKVGANATLKAQLKDGNTVKAEDSVTVRTLDPTVMIKYQGQDRSKLTIYVGDSGSLTADITNQPVGAKASVEWTSTDTDEDYLTFNNGSFTGVAEGSATVTVNVKYDGNVIKSDSLTFTINALSEPTLNLSSGTGLTSYKFGEELDKNGWSATYTDSHGVESNVLDTATFDDLNYIGTKGITATYDNVTSNAVNVTVTNKDATCGSETISEGSGFKNSMPEGDWSQYGAGTDYAAQNKPYLLKMDGTGDCIYCDIDTSASSITVQLFTKMLGGANTSTFTVTAYSDSECEHEITSIESGTLTISGAQNDVVNPTATLQNPDGERVLCLEFYFNKGSNIGVSGGTVSVNDIGAFAPKQAKAWTQYFIDEIGGLCDAGGNTSTANVNAIKAKWSTLSDEYGWMLAESKDYFAGHTTDADIERVLGMYDRIVHRYGQTNFIVDSHDQKVVPSINISPLSIVEGNGTTIIIIVSVIGVSALGGFFFLRKRKENY